MFFIFLIYFFIFGIAVGSFLNILVDRIPRGENSIKGRSPCAFCKHKISWRALFPLLSFLSLNGKCRYCHHKLSVYYPIVELTTGMLFVITLFVQTQTGIWNLEFGIWNIAGLIYYLLIISVFIVIFFTDLKYGIIPFFAVAFGVLVWLIFSLLTTNYSLLTSVYSGIGAFLAFLLLFLVTRGRGMGFGDVVYVFLMGLILGFPKIIMGLYIAFITGAVVSLILVGLKLKKLKGGTIPFGPFLVIGTIISLFWGNFLISLVLPYLR